VAGQELIADHFPDGASQPTEVIARAGAASALTQELRSTRGVTEVLPAVTSTDGELVQIGAVLTDAPDTGGAERTVQRIRERVHAVDGAEAVVGGPTAIGLDTQNGAERDRMLVIPLVLAIVFAILLLLLRSLIAPLLLMATVVLSYFAALGVSALFLEHVMGIAAVDHSLPLLGFVFLVALGVDYNIFLMTRVREEARRSGHARGMLRGLATTGGVITSAGLVLAATFTVLATTPSVFLIGVGVLVAIGVLLDTFVVRSVLVPALAFGLGRRTWWPSRSVLSPASGEDRNESERPELELTSQ
ncbi:MAG: MMPL family transporter, partial [Pseudonocardiaceae bacterium]